MATKAAESRDIAGLQKRIAALEARIDETLTAAGVDEVVKAVPPDKVDGSVLTAAEFNAVKNSVYAWQADVDAGRVYALNNLRTLICTPNTAVSSTVGSKYQAATMSVNSPNVDELRYYCERQSVGTPSGWDSNSWFIERIIDGASKRCSVEFAGDVLKLRSASHVVIQAPPGGVVDVNLLPGSCAIYVNEGANQLTFRVKYSNGTTLKTGVISLT